MSLSSVVKSFAHKHLKSNTITISGKKYLTRYYVIPDNRVFNVWVHHFHSSDQGRDLHNHPFHFSLSFIFDGGYYEEYVKRGENRICARKKVAPCFNVIKNNVFHRVDLLNEEKGTWSIFFTGPRKTTIPEWGFMNHETKEFQYFKENPEAIP